MHIYCIAVDLSLVLCSVGSGVKSVESFCLSTWFNREYCVGMVVCVFLLSMPLYVAAVVMQMSA